MLGGKSMLRTELWFNMFQERGMKCSALENLAVAISTFKDEAISFRCIKYSPFYTMENVSL